MTGTPSRDLKVLMDAAARAIDAADWEKAEPLLRRIVSENSRDASAWHMLAVIAIHGGRGAEAIELVKGALELDRRNAEYLNTLGVAYGEAQQLEEALRSFKRGLKERPDYADAHYNLGKAYRKLGRFGEAEQCYLRARRLDPANPEVANNLATLYSRAGRWKEALPLLQDARATHSDDEALVINMATALLALSGPEAAMGELTAFVRRRPLAAAAQAELGRRLLAEGRLREGWRVYGWRHGRTPGAFPDCDGKRVLLLPDQGLGDQLFFLRFAAALRERAAHVAFACPEKLFPLIEAHPPVNELRREKTELASYDLALPIGDLPRLLQADDTPPPLPISVPPPRLTQWRERLSALGPPPYLGVTWRGGTRRDDRPEFGFAGEAPLYKEIDIASLASALRSWRGSVFILQRLPGHQEIGEFCKALGRAAHDVSAANEDLVDMTAVLSLLDEYVAVSNTNVHLRAGVGKPARILVPFPPEFRWMHAGELSPWFPGFRLYRQGPNRDWNGALDALRADLNH